MILNTSLNVMSEAIFQGYHCHKTNLHWILSVRIYDHLFKAVFVYFILNNYHLSLRINIHFSSEICIIPPFWLKLGKYSIFNFFLKNDYPCKMVSKVMYFFLPSSGRVSCYVWYQTHFRCLRRIEGTKCP